MSGNFRGKVDCLLWSGSSINNTEGCFKSLYDFFSTHPNVTMIAFNFGASSTGTDFWDGAHPFGQNAWFTFRMNATASRSFDTYHTFQWAGSQNQGGAAFGSSPGGPGLVLNSTAPFGLNNTVIGYQCAIGIGGTGGSALSGSYGNPWKGTSNNNGSDTKGTPIWGSPAGGGTGAFIFPRSNSTGGSHTASTQNYAGVFSAVNNANGGTLVRLHVVADDDSFFFWYDINDNGAQVTPALYSGLYLPRSGLTINTPYIVLGTTNGAPLGLAYGDTAGTATSNGGIVGVQANGVRIAQLDRPTLITSSVTNQPHQPNQAFSPAAYDEMDMTCGSWETSFFGLLGQIEFFRETWNVPNYSVKSDFSRVYIGSPTTSDRKYSLPWDSQNNTTPRTTFTRAGVTFVHS